MNDVVIKIQNVTKYYKLYKEPKERIKEALHPLKKRYHNKHYALNDVNLQIKQGEVLGVIGRNGCGKSTLLKLIAGVLKPNSGEISVIGKVTALLELGAGFNPEFTGNDNIHFYAKILGLSDEQINKKLENIKDFAELGDYLYQPVKTYSSGMKSRLGFAVAAHIDPEILILDEVLAVGDDAFKAKCYRKISEFLEKSKTVIIVSHSIHTINQLCNRAVLIDSGRIILDGLPKFITMEYHKILFGRKGDEKKIPKDVKANNTRRNVDCWDDRLPMAPVNMIENEVIKTTDFMLTDSSGYQLNVLTVDEKYRFSFIAELSGQNFEDVLFGITFVSSKGIHVCGIEPKIVNKLDDKKYELIADFTCIFNEDIYTFIVASRMRSAEVVFYSRVEEIGAYKVVNPGSVPRWGLIQL